ncbi:MAG: transcription antitermination factor NusB [Planctomycetota bacterium]
MRKRTLAREVALKFLYQVDLLGKEVLSELEPFLREETDDAEVMVFSRQLIHGTVEHFADIDEKLQGVTKNWDIQRMATIDRNILRIAVYEMLWCRDIPPKVSINEAIELGKRYSTINSGAFINGLLDRIKELAEAKVREESAAS